MRAMLPPHPLPNPGHTVADMTVLLKAWRAGNDQAFSRLVQALHAEFLRMAASRLRGHDSATLERGDVVNEAMLRLMRSPTDWANREHFFATVSLVMRAVLREHARSRIADKRGGQRLQITLTSLQMGEDSMAADLLTLDALLNQLEANDPRSARILEMTYFTGLARADIAEVLDISLATVDRELRFARAWLAAQLGRGLEA
jgi:RNA polymerase sigma factor (TIGR02999 family)